MKDTSGSRAEHLKWCKQRALELLTAGDRYEAVASMLSDLGKHPETSSSQMIGIMLASTVYSDEDARRFIEGFN
jgi:hypothetical protein